MHQPSIHTTRLQRNTSATCLCLCLLHCAASWGQSSTRQTNIAIANRGTGAQISPTLRAEPKRPNASPFSRSPNREIRLPVAVSGFCIVRLRDQQAWQKGLEHHQLTFDGQLYWFASQREKAMFAVNPQRYVPALGGDSVVVLTNTGKRVAGNPRYGILHRQRLFFFQSKDEQEAFRAQPDRYSQIDLANQGYCLVSKIEQQRRLPGLPETTVIVNGMRYQFAGVHQQQKFLINMPLYGVQAASLHPEKPQNKTARNRPQAPPVALQPDHSTYATNKTDPKGNAGKGLVRTAKSKPTTNPALSGYSPVSIRDEGIWVAGEARYESSFDGQKYFMASEAELERFAENPHPYLPALGGKCVVTDIDENKLVPGSTYHAAQHEGRLYLFAGAQQKQTFKANPELYHHADLVAGGNCIVSKVDDGTEVAGLPELLIWHRGRRYLFASLEQQSKFRENIERYQER